MKVGFFRSYIHRFPSIPNQMEKEDQKPLRHQLDRDSDLVEEGRQRTRDRYEHALVVFETLDHSTIHELHPDIAGVRILGSNYILVFDTELACIRTFKNLTTEKGLKVEFYKPIVGEPYEEFALNRLTLLAQGIPDFIGEEDLYKQFPKALKIYKSTPRAKTPYAAMSFMSEADAYEAFKATLNFSIQMFFIDVNYTYLGLDRILNKKQVIVYGVPREITLDQLQDVLVNAREFRVKPFPNDPKGMPFYVSCKFDTVEDAKQIFTTAKEALDSVAVMYARFKSPAEIQSRSTYDFTYQHGPSTQLSLVLPKEWIRDGMMRFHRGDYAKTIHPPVPQASSPNSAAMQRKRKSEKEMLENILAVRTKKKPPPAVGGHDQPDVAGPSHSMSPPAAGSHMTQRSSAHNVPQHQRSPDEALDEQEEDEEENSGGQTFYDRLTILEADAARDGTLSEFHENLASKLQSLSGSEVLELFKNYESGMLARYGGFASSRGGDGYHDVELPRARHPRTGDVNAGKSSYAGRAHRESFILPGDTFVPPPPRKHREFQREHFQQRYDDEPEANDRHYGSQYRTQSSSYQTSKFAKNGKRGYSISGGLLPTPRGDDNRRFAYDESEAASSNVRNDGGNRAPPRSSGFFNNDVYSGPVMRPPARRGKQNFEPKGGWL